MGLEMNDRELMQQRKKIWCSYHIPGCSNLHRLKIDAVFISAANSWEHEAAKTYVCWCLKKKGMKFITEAVSNKTNDRHDIVCLDDGYIYEVETDKKRAKRFEGLQGIIVVKLFENPNIPALVGIA